jgi:HK97 family phage prohead protease
MKTKNISASIKAVSESDGAGIFEALVSRFGTIDSYGEIVMPGAFAKSLGEWAASGDPIPCLYSHDLSDPFSNIGQVIEAKETEDGLWVKVQLDLDNPKALQTFKLLKGRRMREFSFGFKVRQAAQGQRDGKSVVELNELELLEVSPTLIGANPKTELLGVKAAAAIAAVDTPGVKAGKILSKKNEATVRAAYEALGELLSAVAAPTNDEAKASTGPAVKTEEPPAANVEELPAEVSAHSAKSARDLESLLISIETERLIP